MSEQQNNDPSPILQKIDTNLATILGGQKELRERQAKLEGHYTDVEKRLKIADETLKTQTEHLTDVEGQLNKKRFLTGPGTHETDTLRNALPDDLRPYLARVETMSRMGEQGPRNPTAVKMAQADPVRYIAVGGWFRAKIKAALAARDGRTTVAAKWTEYADKLAEAMGGFSSEARAALQEDTNAEGGFLIPTITEAMIGWIIKDNSVVRRGGATVLSMSTKTHQLPSLANDFTMSWIAEEGTITDAAPATPFSQGALTAKKLAGLVTVSIELVQDNVINLMDFVLTHLLTIAGRAEDIQALEGDGTVFTGLFSVAGTASVAGGANALSEDELRKLIYGGEHSSTIERGVIFCHPFIVRDAMGLVTSNAIWFPYLLAGQSAPTPRNIWGVPTFPTSAILRNRGGGTETTAYHGDPAYIVIGERAGSTFEVDPYGKFDTAQLRLRLMRRVGILIWVPGFFTKLTAVTV